MICGGTTILLAFVLIKDPDEARVLLKIPLQPAGPAVTTVSMKPVPLVGEKLRLAEQELFGLVNALESVTVNGPAGGFIVVVTIRVVSPVDTSSLAGLTVRVGGAPIISSCAVARIPLNPNDTLTGTVVVPTTSMATICDVAVDSPGAKVG
jgi:hypothetical protein